MYALVWLNLFMGILSFFFLAYWTRHWIALETHCSWRYDEAVKNRRYRRVLIHFLSQLNLISQLCHWHPYHEIPPSIHLHLGEKGEGEGSVDSPLSSLAPSGKGEHPRSFFSSLFGLTGKYSGVNLNGAFSHSSSKINESSSVSWKFLNKLGKVIFAFALSDNPS